MIWKDKQLPMHIKIKGTSHPLKKCIQFAKIIHQTVRDVKQKKEHLSICFGDMDWKIVDLFSH